MRLHDFLDLPIVELARSENTKREDRAGMIRRQSETGKELQCLLIHSHSKIIINGYIGSNTSGTWTLGLDCQKEFYCVRRHDRVFVL